MPRWVPLFALPNIEIEEPIECETLALVPYDDERIWVLSRAHENFRAYHRRFRDPFGRRLRPAFIVGRRLRHQYRVDAIGSFRDAVAMSVIPAAQSIHALHRQADATFYSDSFALYSWMIDRHYEHIISSTPAQMHLHEVKALHPQSSPDMGIGTVRPGDIDQPLLKELLKRWQQRYRSDRPSWENRALFRSLNMAYAAARMPAGAETGMLDNGRSVALWVSAFEILARPQNEPSGYWKVCQLFERVEWLHRKMKRKTYAVSFGNKKRSVSLPRWIYFQLHQKRNDFVHGNPISEGSLFIRGSRRFLLNYGGPLYRAALTGFLDLRWKGEPPKETAALGAWIAERMTFREPHILMERALESIKTKAAR